MSAAAAPPTPVRAVETAPSPLAPSPRRPPEYGPAIGNQARLRLSNGGGGRIHAKLSIGAVDDPLEAEADRVADQVLGMAGPNGPIHAGAPMISRKCVAGPEDAGAMAAGRGGAEAAPEAVHNVLRASGRPLDAETRAYFEPRFGRDFREVRVHDDAEAAQSASSISASAYTVGSHVVFGDGRFSPTTWQGRLLLAHELTHVAQQGGVPASVQRDRLPDTTTREHLLDLGSPKSLACCDTNACAVDKGGFDCEGFDCPKETGDKSAKNNATGNPKQRFSPRLKCDGACKDIATPYADGDLVIALPSGRRRKGKDQCGQKLTVCANAQSVEVAIREFSNHNIWEVSPAVAAALGVEPDFKGSLYPSANDPDMKDDGNCTAKSKPKTKAKP